MRRSGRRPAGVPAFAPIRPAGENSVLSRDNLKISLAIHTVWRVDAGKVPLFMERYSTTVSNGEHETSRDAIVKVAYGHFVREPLRTFAATRSSGATAWSCRTS